MATRTSRLRKMYEYDDGRTGRSAKPGWKALIFEVLAAKTGDEYPVAETIRIERDTLPADMWDCGSGHGVMQKVGDEISGIARQLSKDGVAEDTKLGYAPQVAESIRDAVANLQAGVWVEEGEGSSGAGNVTILIEAIGRVYTEAGHELTPDVLQSIRTKAKDADYRKGARARTDVAKHVRDIELERAKERAKAAAQAAKTDKPEVDITELVS